MSSIRSWSGKIAFGAATATWSDGTLARRIGQFDATQGIFGDSLYVMREDGSAARRVDIGEITQPSDPDRAPTSRFPGQPDTFAGPVGVTSSSRAVVGQLHPVGRLQLRGAVGEEQPSRARGRVGGERLFRAQVATRLAVGIAGLERRLADEQVDVPGQVGHAPARPRVARVGERGAAVRDAKAVRLESVVGEAQRHDVEPRGGGEDRLGVVLAHDKGSLEHVGEAESRAELLEVGPPAAVDPELRPDVVVATPVEAPPDPRTRSPQWSRWKWVIAIESTAGHGSLSRSRPSTPGPQSSSRRRPSDSTTYPECAPPAFGHAGDDPMTMSRTFLY